MAKWRVFAFNRETLVPVTGDEENITAEISLNDGDAEPTADVHPSETSGGYYKFTLSDDEAAAAYSEITPVSSTPGVEVIGVPGYRYNMAAIKAKTDLITTGSVRPVSRLVSSAITLYVGETHEQSVPVASDYSATAVRMVFQKKGCETDIAVIENADFVSKASGEVVINVPAALTVASMVNQSILWSLRTVAGNKHVEGGTVVILDAANKDA